MFYIHYYLSSISEGICVVQDPASLIDNKTLIVQYGQAICLQGIGLPSRGSDILKNKLIE
jgi:hypothetical protein